MSPRHRVTRLPTLLSALSPHHTTNRRHPCPTPCSWRRMPRRSPPHVTTFDPPSCRRRSSSWVTLGCAACTGTPMQTRTGPKLSERHPEGSVHTDAECIRTPPSRVHCLQCRRSTGRGCSATAGPGSSTRTSGAPAPEPRCARTPAAVTCVSVRQLRHIILDHF